MSVFTKTEVANFSLAHLGATKRISDLDTERSQEAITLKGLYNLAVENVLSDHYWPFATIYADLALVEESPNDFWAYSYLKPSDALRYIVFPSGVNPENTQSLVKIEEGWGSTGTLIFTNEPDAQIKYVKTITNQTSFSPDFILCLSYKLAFLAAPSLHPGDSNNMADKMMNLYKMQLYQCLANKYNQTPFQEPPESEFIRARE